MPPQTIIYVHHEKALGGAPLSLLYLIRQLDRTRYHPIVICLREGPAAELFRGEKLDVRVVSGPDLSHTELVWFRIHQWPRLACFLLGSIPLFFKLRSAFSTIARETQGKPLVHLNSSTLLTAAAAARSSHLPLIWHIREPLARGYIGFRRACLRWAVRTFPSHVIAISENDARQLNLPAGTNNLSVIHNFVNFDLFCAGPHAGEIRRERKIPKDSPVLLFLGGSAKVKGAEILLESLPSLLQQAPTLHMIMAGECDPEFKLQAVSGPRMPFQDRIHVLGPRSDVPRLLEDSTLLLFPSIVPHFARPVIEAAAMARPVIASDLGGVRELVLPGETAILVPPNNSPALTTAILDLLRDSPRLFRLGQQAQEWARKKFDAQKNAAETFHVYESLFKADR